MIRKITIAGQPFTVELTPDLEEGGYVVSCLEIPAVNTEGETEQEAVDNAIGAIELCMEVENERNITRHDTDSTERIRL